MARREAGTPATLALTRSGIPFTGHSYDHDPRSTRYGLEAAEALGLSAAEVFKTLLALVDGTPVVGVVPVSGTLDLKALAAAADGRRAEMADPATAQRLTGYVVGGISPIGQRRPLRTIIDTSARDLTTMYVSGGRRGYDIALAPADLIVATSGSYADIGRPGT
jgi:Cys-tRNA(Pro)/Cys-tRNA(Cys) deacylase